jgi:hypothetical protein
MAVLYDVLMPEGVSIELLDEVSADMGVETDKPKGLVLHVHFLTNGRARIVDVWESTEDYDAFNRDRLMPAMQKATERHGMNLDGPAPEATISEVLGIVRG